MADKKLSEVTKVTDMAYVPVILSDGSVGQIAKADLASVVAGVMGFSTNDSLTYKGVLTAELEASATLPNGVYRQNENPMLSCDGVTNLYRGQLFSFRGIADSGNYYGFQIYVTGDGVSKHSRTIEYGYVRPWQRIDNFGYNSLAKLSEGVVNSKTVVKSYTFTTGTTNVIQMNYGFAMIAFNSATVYMSVSHNGTLSKTIEGTLNENITSIDYADGYVTIKVGYAVQLGTVIYAPHGTILI